MGMYTRMVFNAELKDETPAEVIETLRWLVGEELAMLDTESEPGWGCFGLFNVCSAYHAPRFTSNSFVTENEYGGGYGVSIFCDIKNYWGQFEKFIEWITPYVQPQGYDKTFLGYTIYEEDDEPELLYVHHETEEN